MAQRKTRFSEADGKGLREVFQACRDDAIKKQGNEKPYVDPKTEAERDQIWTTWTEYCRVLNEELDIADRIDPCRFWLDFAREPSAIGVLVPVQSFLKDYVNSSYEERVTLGPEERAMVRTVNYTQSVIEVWRRLVASADFRVLRPERRALRIAGKRTEADQLNLKWEQKDATKEGPGFVVVQWIKLEMTPEVGLIPAPVYRKVEATAADIILILTTLWTRAEDIPASPVTRVSVANAIIQMSTGGFRPGILEDTKCQQYTISLVRDPNNRTQVRPVVTHEMIRNKKSEDEKIGKDSTQTRVTYHSGLVPYLPLCAASLVIARALQMGALAVDFDSVHTLFHRPALGRTDRIPIPWKDEFLDKPLFPLQMPEFRKVWDRCVAVIGCRKRVRSYAMRVGAGARIDDVLSPALRNYIMSHTGPVFEHAYQTAVVRPNLAAIAFGPKAVRQDEALFSELRNMSQTRDEGAPISVSEEQIAKFRERRDVTELRNKIQASTDQREKTRLRNQINSIINTCKRLQLEADREAYFKEADQLRLHGFEPELTPRAGGPGMAAPVAACISHCTLQGKEELATVGTSSSEQFIEAVRAYLSSPVTSARRQAPAATTTQSKSPRDSCCFVCLKAYPNRPGLTRHFRNTHLNDGTFNKPFACQECKRAGAAQVFVDGLAQWCNHLEHAHGMDHTPSIKPGVSHRDRPSNSRWACLLCEKPMASMRTLLDHMNRTEIPRCRQSLRVACGACTREGLADAKPMSLWKWLAHARDVHMWSLPGVAPCPLCGQLCAPGPSLQKHFAAKHSDELGERLDYAARLASTSPAGEMRDTHDFEECLRHGVEKHLLGQSAADAAGRKRRRDCDMDGEYTAPAAKRTKGDREGECLAAAAKSTEADGDGKCPAPAARHTEHTESHEDRECPPPPTKRKRAARHNVAYKKELSRVVIYDADSDPCEDVIICASTVDEQQTCHLKENHIGSSAALDPGFLRHVDPALLAPWRPASAVQHTAAVSSDLHTPEALRRPRRRRGQCHG